MITDEQIRKQLSSLRPHTLTSARKNQRYRVPMIIENTKNGDHLSTHDESFVVKTPEATKYANLYNTDRFRYNGKWYSYRYSADTPESNYGIIKVDDLPFNPFTNRINKKSFISRLDRAVFQGLIEPIMLFVDYKFVKWDYIDIVYDCDDIWLILRDNKYNYHDIANSVFDIVVLPFKCEYLGDEPENLFNLNYAALCEYMQVNSSIGEDKEFYIQSPTLDTEYVYNHIPLNIGGWLYSQIKRSSLGTLSKERQDKLRNISIAKNVFNDSGVVIDTLITRYNALDADVPTNKLLYDTLYFMPLEKYNDYSMIKFDEDGKLSDDGEYKIVILDEDLIFKSFTTSESKAYIDLSSINNLLFRENYIVFQDKLLSPHHLIMTSINNINMIDNPDKHTLDVMVIYNKSTDHVIRNTDKFMKSYMNEQAIRYLEINYSSEYHDPKIINAITDDGRMIKQIEAYYLDNEFAFVPKLTDYIVFINNYANDVVRGIIDRAIVPLDFEFNRDNTFEDNYKNALNSVVKYNPSLLNPVYHTFVDQRTFTGKQANDSLLYHFMYENRYGLKIPRLRYRNHETYIMVFVNGELIDTYYKMLAYANFFFIPEDDGFKFDDNDVIEVLYFKNINNNEIRFAFTEELLNKLVENKENTNYLNISVFKPYINPKELKIFSHYPEDMLYYPTLITHESEDIAFNVSYRDSEHNLCVKQQAIDSLIKYSLLMGILYKNLVTGTTYNNKDVQVVDLADGTIYDNIDVVENGIKIAAIGQNLTANASNIKDLKQCLVAVSSHKFIYQRLFVDYKSYRIKLDSRFRYCDNQRQYVLFINGRRMKQDSYFITTPKHTRPFNGIYLYTARFVNPEDRIELFYLPYPMDDINFDDNYKYELKENGYFEFDRTQLKVPFSKDLYLFFINGKKIPSTDIIDIDSHTVRIIVDTNTRLYPCITAINVDSIPEVENYLKDEYTLSNYDSLINFLKSSTGKPYDLLDKIFGYYTKISNGEEDKTWANVAKIAILNEIIRDFWVTSGYDYQSQLFVYDYYKDELFEKTKDNVLILPALDANPEINIKKNDISLLYFYTDPEGLLFELGNKCESFKLMWEFSQRLNQPWRIISQDINGKEIDVNAREYEWKEEIINESRKYTLTVNTGQEYLIHDAYLDFVNGIYWGVVDEDELQYYRISNATQYLDEIFLVVPKDGKVPSLTVQKAEMENKQLNEKIPENYYIVRGGITYANAYEVGYSMPIYDPELNYVGPYNGFIAIVQDNTFRKGSSMYTKSRYTEPTINFFAVADNGNRTTGTSGVYTNKDIYLGDYYGYHYEGDLPTLIKRLDKHLVRYPNIKLNDYIIGNNNYFVFACPTRLVYDAMARMKAEFFLPDPKNDDIVAHCRDDKTTPVYTDGNFDSLDNTLIEMDEMKMVYMGECKFTNDYGFTERYSVWKTNGFFTRLFENYGIDMHFKIGDFGESKVVYTNNSENVEVINYVDGIEQKDEHTLLEEHTSNTIQEERETVDTSGVANTLPKSNAASLTKTVKTIIHTESSKPAPTRINPAPAKSKIIKSNINPKDENLVTVQMGDSSVDDKRVKELLDQGIFLI